MQRPGWTNNNEKFCRAAVKAYFSGVGVHKEGKALSWTRLNKHLFGDSAFVWIAFNEKHLFRSFEAYSICTSLGKIDLNFTQKL